MDRTYTSHFEDRIELTQSEEHLQLRFDRDSEGSVLLFLREGAAKSDLDLEVKDNARVRIFVKNDSGQDARLKIKADVLRDGDVRIGLLDLNDRPLCLEFDADLKEPGASLDLRTAVLCMREVRKDGEIHINNQAPYTYGTMSNYAVCFDGGIYNMAAAGRIVKGAREAQSHQQTRVLTMGKDHKACVIPILYIDENEVKASHALTIGQPDAQQLYYLQSRGLSAVQAIGLLSIGYFMPVVDMVEDEALHESLRVEMEEKVGLYEH